MPYMIGGNFQNTKIRQSTPDNPAGEYIKDGVAYAHDFATGVKRFSDWYISHYFRKIAPSSPVMSNLTAWSNSTDYSGSEGELALSYYSDGSASNPQLFMFSDAGFARYFMSSNFYYSETMWPSRDQIWLGSALGGGNYTYGGNYYSGIGFEYTTYALFGLGAYAAHTGSWYNKWYRPLDKIPGVDYKTYNGSQNKNAWQTLVIFNNSAKVVRSNMYSDKSYFTRINEHVSSLPALPALWYPNGAPRPQINAYSLPTNDYMGNTVTDPHFYDSGIEGPYPDLNILSSGVQALDVYIYAHRLYSDTTGGSTAMHNIAEHITGGGVAVPLSSYPFTNTPENALTKKRWNFLVFQKPVSRFKDSLGDIVSKGNANLNTHFHTITAGGSIILDNGSSSMEATVGVTTKVWRLSKYSPFDPSADLYGFVPLTLGVDPEISFDPGETLSTSLVHITFNALGKYKIGAHLITTLNAPTYPGNTGSWLLDDPYSTVDSDNGLSREITIDPGLPLIEEASVWPNIFTIVTSNDPDPYTPGPPLTSAQPFTVSIEATIDSTGVWKVTNPNTLPNPTITYYPGDGPALSIMQWKARMEYYFIIRCLIKNVVTGVSFYRYGFAAQDVTLQAGTYTFQYSAVPSNWYQQQLDIQAAEIINNPII